MKDKDKIQQQETTGHSWDGITEYQNKDPLWLRYTFYMALLFAIGYWFLYPSWPTPDDSGILKWTSAKEAAEGVKEIEKIRAKYQVEFDKLSFQEIYKQDDMMKFAITGGQSVFQNNCAVCHGAGGGGNLGFPNLTAGAWLWGGKLEDLYTTIKYGIRSGHPETRESIMAAFGKDKILTKEQINILVDFVRLMHKKSYDVNSDGYKIFQENCASCHGKEGEGGKEFGAPALNDAIWLYGSSKQEVFDVIYNGRGGLMPYWDGKLSDSSIRQVVIYVHELGGGE